MERGRKWSTVSQCGRGGGTLPSLHPPTPHSPPSPQPPPMPAALPVNDVVGFFRGNDAQRIDSCISGRKVWVLPRAPSKATFWTLTQLQELTHAGYMATGKTKLDGGTDFHISNAFAIPTFPTHPPAFTGVKIPSLTPDYNHPKDLTLYPVLCTLHGLLFKCLSRSGVRMGGNLSQTWGSLMLPDQIFLFIFH